LPKELVFQDFLRVEKAALPFEERAGFRRHARLRKTGRFVFSEQYPAFCMAKLAHRRKWQRKLYSQEYGTELNLEKITNELSLYCMAGISRYIIA
jgi:hypothetical protein